MKIGFFVLMILLVSCSSTKKVKNNLYQTSCHMIFGNCEKQMIEKCPDGYVVTNKGSRFGFWGMEKEIFYECKE